MKEVIKKINIYNFEELSEKIQNKLIEKEKEKMEDEFCECWLKEEMEEKAKELLQKYFKNKATFKNVYYDLSYCQGSGAMIEFELTYYNKTFSIKQYGHYYHKNSFIINTYDLTDKQESQLKEKIIKMNEELTSYGYNSIEYYWNCDDEAIENLKKYQFTIDGEIFIN